MGIQNQGLSENMLPHSTHWFIIISQQEKKRLLGDGYPTINKPHYHIVGCMYPQKISHCPHVCWLNADIITMSIMLNPLNHY